MCLSRWRKGVSIGRSARTYTIAPGTSKIHVRTRREMSMNCIETGRESGSQGENVEEELDGPLRLRSLAYTDMEQERGRQLSEYLFALRTCIEREER